MKKNQIIPKKKIQRIIYLFLQRVKFLITLYPLPCRWNNKVIWSRMNCWIHVIFAATVFPVQVTLTPLRLIYAATLDAMSILVWPPDGEQHVIFSAAEQFDKKMLRCQRIITSIGTVLCQAEIGITHALDICIVMGTSAKWHFFKSVLALALQMIVLWQDLCTTLSQSDDEQDCIKTSEWEYIGHTFTLHFFNINAFGGGMLASLTELDWGNAKRRPKISSLVGVDVPLIKGDAIAGMKVSLTGEGTMVECTPEGVLSRQTALLHLSS